MATVTIDGKTITVEDGTLILDAARSLGIEIPTFCYQAKLSRLASCRLCLVEIEGQKKLQPSCATPVLDGMVIHTQSPAVVTARRAMLEFLLANHPLDCPVCDKGGECELQDKVFAFGPREGRFTEWKRTFHSKDYVLSPVIIKNANRCVQCQRCVRICEEIVGASALGSIGRGVKTEETSFMRAWLNCDHCGNCIEVCPVGSLMSLPYRYKARPWDLKEVDTVCPYCGTGCTLTVGLRDGQLLRVRSRRQTGVNEETLCVKGRFGLDFVVHEDRIKRPMIRKNDVLVPVSWREVSNYLKERLLPLKGKGDSVGGLLSAQMTNEEIYTFQKLFREVFGSNNIDSSSRWPVASEGDFYPALLDLISTGIYRGNLREFLSADTLLVAGSNLTDENPVTEYAVRYTLSVLPLHLFILSSRPSRLDKAAKGVKRYIPGREVRILASVLKEVMKAHEEDLKRTFGDVGEVIQGEVIEDDFVRALSSRLLGSRRISILVGTDLLRSPLAVDAFRVISNLIKVLRAAGKECGLQFLFDRSNQMGAIDMGAFPRDGGMGFGSLLEASRDGRISFLYVLGEDPVLNYPDGRLVREALSQVGLLLVQDAFMTETARMAHVVLPGATFAEKDGTFTSNEGRVQRVRAFYNPPFEARRDLEIISHIASLLGVDLETDPSSIFAEIKDLISPYRGVDYEGLGDNGLFTGHEKGVDKGLHPVAIRDVALEGWGFITGNHLYHSGYLSQRSRLLGSLIDAPFLEIGKEGADSLGVREGDSVKVRRNGQSIELKVRVKEGLPEGLLFIPENFGSLSINNLMEKGVYPFPVEVRKNG